MEWQYDDYRLDATGLQAYPRQPRLHASPSGTCAAASSSPPSRCWRPTTCSGTPRCRRGPRAPSEGVRPARVLPPRLDLRGRDRLRRRDGAGRRATPSSSTWSSRCAGVITPRRYVPSLPEAAQAGPPARSGLRRPQHRPGDASTGSLRPARSRKAGVFASSFAQHIVWRSRPAHLKEGEADDRHREWYRRRPGGVRAVVELLPEIAQAPQADAGGARRAGKAARKRAPRSSHARGRRPRTGRTRSACSRSRRPTASPSWSPSATGACSSRRARSTAAARC